MFINCNAGLNGSKIKLCMFEGGSPEVLRGRSGREEALSTDANENSGRTSVTADFDPATALTEEFLEKPDAVLTTVSSAIKNSDPHLFFCFCVCGGGGMIMFLKHK